MVVARYLVQAWTCGNTPRRLSERHPASFMNGVLNLSVLDGWWASCCRDVG
jgi:hypothetical protein